MKQLYWSVRRELWEYPAIYVAPAGVGALLLLGFLISTLHLPADLRAAALDPARQTELLQRPFHYAAALIMASTFIVAVFYCVEALYAERRDRSTLFWKSLPVSDVTAVVAKASIPLVILPLVTFAVTVVTQLGIVLLGTVALAVSGAGAGTLWSHVPLPRMSWLLLYHLVTVHALWWAPFFGWFLLVSAWARRAPFLWATLPLVAIAIIEKIAFDTNHFVTMLQTRYIASGEAVMAPGALPIDPMTHLTPSAFLSSASLWLGWAVMVACLVVAVRLRRARGPI
jgi:ABC-2 type transport system permease protein